MEFKVAGLSWDSVFPLVSGYNFTPKGRRGANAGRRVCLAGGTRRASVIEREVVGEHFSGNRQGGIRTRSRGIESREDQSREMDREKWFMGANVLWGPRWPDAASDGHRRGSAARTWTEAREWARQTHRVRPPTQTDGLDQRRVCRTRLGVARELAARLLKRDLEWKGETRRTARYPRGPE